jgi:hypothetical protein
MNLKFANSPDSELEQSFFQLAFERLQEKLYNLLPFLVGFEVANKSQDGTKALGVFGFKSNNGQMLFVPAFFINGDVKGIDIMYSKNNEQFYPLNEDFAELFLKDEATGLGKPSKEDEQKINQHMTPMDLKDLVRPPRTAKISYASVIDYVEESSNKTKEAFYNLMKADGDFAESVTRFYSLDKIAKAITPKVARKKTLPMSSVSVVTKDDDMNNLTESQKSEVLTSGYVVIDKRKEEEKSKFGLVKYEEKFSNPDESGFYSYLTQSGSLRYAIVVNKLLQLDKHFPSAKSLVLDLDSSHDGQAYFVDNNTIFTKGKYKIKEFPEVLSMMTDPAEATPSYDETYVLINENLKATEPFRVRMNFKTDSGVRCLQVEKARNYDSFAPSRSRNFEKKNDNHYFKTEKEDYGKFNLLLTKKQGDKLEYDNGSILVPKGFKLMNIRLGVRSCCDGAEVSTDPSAYETSRKLRKAEEERYEQGKPGSLSNLFGALRSTSIYPLTVSSNGSEYFVSVGEAKKKFDNAANTKIAMVKILGLDHKQASELIDNTFQGSVKKGYIKFAYTGDQHFAPWDPTPRTNELGQPEYDGYGHSETMAQTPSYTDDPTSQGRGTMTQPEGIDGAVNTANQLAQSGQKEIFDTHTIATLAKYVSPESKVTAYMPDFVSCLDKLGRMLFLVHWETDKFEEMYGRSELPELVELLSNVFKNLGDLVIFLKRKSPQLSINATEKDMDA